MSRPLRIEYAGACYHVINRGNRRQTIFGTESDGELFLEKLQEFSAVYDVRVICYCLMNNHFHLYIKTADANLSRFMQSFLTSFTISKNRRDASSGHLFQGRYKAILVEDAAYGLELSRYIHLNPVRTQGGTEMGTAVRRRLLRGFRLSSYPSIIGLRSCPKWLERTFLLDRYPGNLQARQSVYAKYVEEGLRKDIDDPMKSVVASTILGTEPFVDRMRRGLVRLADNLNLRGELGGHARLAAWIPLDKVVLAVSKSYGSTASDILRKHSRNNEARQVLLYLACKYCRGRNSMSELGEQLGHITIGALSCGRFNMAKRISKDKSLGKRVENAENYIIRKKV